MRNVALWVFATMLMGVAGVSAAFISDGGTSGSALSVSPPRRCPPKPLGPEIAALEKEERGALKSLESSPGYKKESPKEREEQRKALRDSFKARRDAGIRAHEEAEKLCRKPEPKPLPPVKARTPGSIGFGNDRGPDGASSGGGGTARPE